MSIRIFIHIPKANKDLWVHCVHFASFVSVSHLSVLHKICTKSTNSIQGIFLCFTALVFSLASENSVMKVEKVMSERH
jgi:hypothetical protein